MFVYKVQCLAGKRRRLKGGTKNGSLVVLRDEMKHLWPLSGISRE